MAELENVREAEAAEAAINNDTILDFLKKQGYNYVTLDKVKESRVSNDSIHLLTVDDFKDMGVALADARLLVEKFRNKNRAEELASMVAAVRSGNGAPVKKKKIIDRLKIEYSWHHYSGDKQKYSVVKIGNGGGIRYGEFKRSVKLQVVFDDMKDKYFTGGKNNKGRIKYMISSILGGDKEEIKDLDIAIGDFFEMKGLKSRKFYLQTRKKTFVQSVSTASDDSDDSLDDFDVELPRNSTPKKADVINAKQRQNEEERNERRRLIQQQNDEYLASLECDRRKVKEKAALEEKKQKEEGDRLKNENAQVMRQMRRKQLLHPEPTLTDDSVLVVVNHIELGRLQRFFWSNEKCESVYNWIGSQAPVPELFGLFMVPNTLVDPDWAITKVERNVLSMTPNDTSDFTMDIEVNVGIGQEKSPDLVCPICKAKQASLRLLELHSTQCAEEKFVEVYSINDSDDELPEAEIHIVPDDIDLKQYADSETLVKSLQYEIQKCSLGEIALKLKIRRGFSFTDFCERLEKKWIAKNIGNQLFVEFYGEAGVDQGGVKRDFFSECMEELKTMLFVSNSAGEWEPALNLYSDISGGVWKKVGILFASSILMSGPAPNFMAPWMFAFIIGGTEKVLEQLPKTLCTGKIELLQMYNKISAASCDQDLQNLLNTDEGFDLCADICYRGLPSSISMANKDNILRSIFLKEVLQPLLPAMEQLTNGLKTYNLLNIIQQHQSLFYYVFCISPCLSWTYEKFEDFVDPKFSEEGSSKRKDEIDVYKSWMDAVEEIFHEGHGLKLNDLMKFITGSATIPPLGLPNQLAVEFKHGCEKGCKCKISTMTCDLTLMLPMHYKNTNDMIEALFDSVKLSRGFHLL